MESPPRAKAGCPPQQIPQLCPAFVSLVRCVGGCLGHMEQLHHLLLPGSGGPLEGEWRETNANGGGVATVGTAWICHLSPTHTEVGLGLLMALSLAPRTILTHSSDSVKVWGMTSDVMDG